MGCGDFEATKMNADRKQGARKKLLPAVFAARNSQKKIGKKKESSIADSND